jgi:hypothetical protein
MDRLHNENISGDDWMTPITSRLKEINRLPRIVHKGFINVEDERELRWLALGGSLPTVLQGAAESPVSLHKMVW